MSNLVITFLASFLIWVMFAGLFFLWFFDGRIKREHVTNALLVSFTAWSIAQIIKLLVPTLRPFEINNLPPLTVTVPSDPAFPSSHTAIAFGLATSVFRYHKKAGIIFLLSALAVGVGRVFGNVHYIGDIAGGAFVGIVAAIILQSVRLDKLLKKRT
jgi:membrane-associated phospholipid phosphatase